MIKVNDKVFDPLISHEQLKERITEIAADINEDYKDKKPLFIVILNGAFLFAADIFKQLDMPCEITFTRLASYMGTSSTGKVNFLMQLADTVKNKDVIIIEDIIDTGRTLSEFLPHLMLEQPASIRIATLLLKPAALKFDLKADYVGFEIENKFVVGYGLDYDGYGRNLAGIYQLKGAVPSE